MSKITNTPEILSITKENIPDFNKISLIFINKDDFNVDEDNNIELILTDNLNNIEYPKQFEIILHENNDYFIKETNTFNKKLICSELLLLDIEFSVKHISMLKYNECINYKKINAEV